MSNVVDISDWEAAAEKQERDARRREAAKAKAVPGGGGDSDKAGTEKQPPVIFSADELGKQVFAPMKYVVPGYIAEGLTLLAGKPKIGKSWFCLDVGIAVATGGTCLGGVQCEQGEVLYLALEDNRRRLQSRMRMLGAEFPPAMHFSTEWPRADDGGIDALAEWLAKSPAARLVMIDVLAMFRMPKGQNESLYDADYNSLKKLHALASDTGVAILPVHHLRKAASESGDPFETVSGTMGLTGAVDTALIFDRTSSGVTLYARGRDIEEIETAVTFDRDACRWVALGEPGEVRMSAERKEILDLLRNHSDPMGPKDIAVALGSTDANVRQTLKRMAEAGEVEKAARGKYIAGK